MFVKSNLRHYKVVSPSGGVFHVRARSINDAICKVAEQPYRMHFTLTCAGWCAERERAKVKLAIDVETLAHVVHDCNQLESGYNEAFLDGYRYLAKTLGLVYWDNEIKEYKENMEVLNHE